MNDSSFIIPRSSLLSYLWYEATFWAGMAGMTLAFSLRFEGRRNVPREGPVLLIANHQSFLDPMIAGLSSPRHLRFLARKTLFRHAFVARILHRWNAIPVDHHGVAKDGLRAILAQLERGEAVLVFPEGERTWDGKMQPLRPGIQLLLRRTQAPVVPIGIAGAYAAFSRHDRLPHLAPLFLPARKGTVAVSVGRPLDSRQLAELSREKLLQELTASLQAAQTRAERLRRKP